MSKDYIEVTTQLPMDLARGLAMVLDIPESAIGSVDFSVVLQQLIQHHIEQQLSEPTPPSGKCEWCGCDTDDGIVIQGLSQDLLRMVCPSCEEKANTIMRAKGKIMQQGLHPKPVRYTKGDLEQLARSLKLELGDHPVCGGEGGDVS